MLNKMKTILAATALSVAASAGTAATLNLDTTDPILTASSVSVEFSEIGVFAFSAFGEIDGSAGIATDGLTELFLDAEVTSSDPFTADFGTLDVSDETDFVVLGDLVDFGFTDTSLEFLFDTFDGRFAADFGAQVLVEFTLARGSNLTFLSGLEDGDVVEGGLTLSAVDLAPIPLPAGLPLLLAGLGGFWVLRRRQTA